MADCHLPEVPQGPGVKSTRYCKGSQTPTSGVSDRDCCQSVFFLSQTGNVSTGGHLSRLVPQGIHLVYEDLLIVTSRDEHNCTLID